MKKIAFVLMSMLLAACSHTERKSDSETEARRYDSANNIPVEYFFRNPAVVGYQVSPDGKTLAVLKTWKNRLNVFVHPTHDPQNVKQLTFVEDRDIAGFLWKGSDRILYLKDSNGDENYHVYAVDLQSGKSHDLTPFAGTRSSVVDDLQEVSPTDVLIQNNRRDKEVFDLYRVNVQTGESKMLVENKYKISTWLIDHDGDPRGGSADDGVSSVLYFQKEKGGPIEKIFKTDFKNQFTPIAMTADNKNIYMASNLGHDLVSIVEMDPLLPSKKFIVKTLFSHPKYDVDGASYSRKLKTLNRVTVITDRAETSFLTADDQKDWNSLKKQFSDYTLALSNASLDERTWVVRTYSDHTYGSYFVYDRDSHKITKLGEIAPWLQPELMADMKTIHYKTRDGLHIEGYLTIPAGATERNLPVIVNPHGGPWARDMWRFDPEVQFLASRGYAVLQMNFRGSTGYGRKFWEASFKQWGKKMQNDITDGVRWMESQKIADSKRVCIYGGSYGGYATLAGITFTPDLYACAVDYVGVANLFTFMKTIPPYWKPFMDMMYAMVGDPHKDKTLMASASPVLHADRIKAPLFIAQGANDPRVNKNESDQMVEALHKRGIDVEYMVKANEGHGFHNQENRFDFYRAMEKFLAKHLKGGANIAIGVPATGHKQGSEAM